MKEHNWFRLDNAAKVYPVIQTDQWTPMFRLVAVMDEDVCPELLQKALDSLTDRFPSFFVCMRTGFFWYYLEKLKKTIKVEEDVINPTGPVMRGEPLLRIRYYRNRIAFEIHHVVTDGNGGLVFFKTLLAQYLRLLGHDIPFEKGILNPKDAPDPGELDDAFLRFSRMKVLPTRMEERAYRIRGTKLPASYMRVTTGTMSAKQVYDVAKSYNATITEFLAAALLQSVYRIQLADGKPQRPVKVSVPVNLRQFYPTNTLRNFSQYLNPGVDPQYGEFSFEEILSSVHHYMRLMCNEKNLNARMSKNVADEINPVLRVVPLFLKNVAIFAEWSRIGEKLFSITLSNLGKVDMPEEMSKHVERLDFVLHTSRINACECSVSTLGDKLSLSVASAIAERYVERLVFTSLVKHSIHVLIESNEL